MKHKALNQSFGRVDCYTTVSLSKPQISHHSANDTLQCVLPSPLLVSLAYAWHSKKVNAESVRDQGGDALVLLDSVQPLAEMWNHMQKSYTRQRNTSIPYGIHLSCVIMMEWVKG